jgi:flagellum-specific peptidoglycan hydrolase FlgJ
MIEYITPIIARLTVLCTVATIVLLSSIEYISNTLCNANKIASNNKDTVTNIVIVHDTVFKTQLVKRDVLVSDAAKIVKVKKETTNISINASKLDKNSGLIKGVGSKNQSNSMSNLAFILNPAYIKKHKLEYLRKHYDSIVDGYINDNKGAAIAQMKLHKIPASITLAQGILESNSGSSFLCRKANNHFGIKCFDKKCKRGHCINATDDTHKDFFVVYKNATQSYEAHSIFLKKPRYKRLLELPTKDYKNWAYGLKACGYATAANYAEALITIIQTEKLHKFDN